jgi:histidinol-phosphate aminotransferase
MRPLPGQVLSYDAPSTDEIVRRTGLPISEIVRFDGNTSPRALPSSRAEALIEELARIHTYPHGGYPRLEQAIAQYAGVAPDNVVLGAGADDLILLLTRSFAGRGDRVAIANDPTYPLFDIAVRLAGAEVAADDPVLTICCRPNNPTGELGKLPDARPLLVDEAYFEYSGETAVDLIEDDVVVIRTFSKAFGLAAARIGYAIADAQTAGELRVRQDPLPITTFSAALALAALRAGPPEIQETIEERDRLADGLRTIGFEPLPSQANFVYVPMEDARAAYERLLRQGLVVRPFEDAIRITVHTPEANERVLRALQQADG